MLALLFVLSAAGCGGADSACWGVGSANDPWTVSEVYWNGSGGVSADRLQYHGYAGLAEKSCQDTDRVQLDAAGRPVGQEAGYLFSCSDAAPSLGPCVSPVENADRTNWTYDSGEGWVVTVNHAQRFIERISGSTTDYHVSLDNSEPVDRPIEMRGGAIYLWLKEGADESVTRFDSMTGTMLWTVPLVTGGNRD
jgi:hypothetical protein